MHYITRKARSEGKGGGAERFMGTPSGLEEAFSRWTEKLTDLRYVIKYRLLH